MGQQERVLDRAKRRVDRGFVVVDVETRGGEYFFLPSITALRMIGDGIVDPT